MLKTEESRRGIFNSLLLMGTIKLIDYAKSFDNQQYPFGWNEETRRVFILRKAGAMEWEDTLKFADTEEEAKLVAQEYLNQD